MTMEDQLQITLMKLHLNVSMLDLSVRFGISRTTIANSFITVVCALHEIIFKRCMQTIPSQQKMKASLPTCCQPFPLCRHIFDCN